MWNHIKSDWDVSLCIRYWHLIILFLLHKLLCIFSKCVRKIQMLLKGKSKSGKNLNLHINAASTPRKFNFIEVSDYKHWKKAEPFDLYHVYCDLDLWPLSLKIIRVHPVVIGDNCLLSLMKIHWKVWPLSCSQGYFHIWLLWPWTFTSDLQSR